MVMISFGKSLYYLSKRLAENLDGYTNAVMNRNTSAVLCCDGRSGEGKSTLSFQVAGYLANKVAEWKDEYEPLPNGEKHKPEFNLDNVVFTPIQFIERLQKAKKGDIIIFDEAMVISNRSALSAMNRAVIIMMSQIRSKNLFIFFNINSIFDLDKNLALYRVDCLMHVYSESDKLGYRGSYAVYPSPYGILRNLYINGKRYYSYRKPSPAFSDKFKEAFLVNEIAYEAKKQEAINNFYLADNREDTKARKSRNLYVKYIKKTTNLTNEDIGEIGEISMRTIGTILEDKTK